MLWCCENFVPLGQLIAISMPRQARKTSGTGILPNHIHLLLQEKQDTLGEVVKRHPKSCNRSENPLIYNFGAQLRQSFLC